MTPPGVAEHYRGSDPDRGERCGHAVPQDLLRDAHHHAHPPARMAAIFVFSGFALALCERPAEPWRRRLIVEPFVALLVSFAVDVAHAVCGRRDSAGCCRCRARSWRSRSTSSRFSSCASWPRSRGGVMKRREFTGALGAGLSRRPLARRWPRARTAGATFRRALVLGDGPAGAPPALRRLGGGGVRGRAGGVRGAPAGRGRALPVRRRRATSPSSIGAPAGGRSRVGPDLTAVLERGAALRARDRRRVRSRRSSR